MGTACGKAEEFEREVVVAHENLMHQKRVFPPLEIIPALPELVDFKGIPKKKTREGIFEDPDFPATNASLGGVTGDNANPNVAKYLEALTFQRSQIFFLLLLLYDNGCTNCGNLEEMMQ